jgi:cytoskeletal protein CcmA (bactofilin family)
MMFSKDNEQLESFIGSGTEFQGELNVKGTLRVEGKLDGKVNAAFVILGETGVIKGEVSAKKIIIGGKIEGNLRIQEIVEIKATGKVLGDIFTKKISITEGAKVNGKIEMEVDENRVIDLSKGGRLNTNLHGPILDCLGDFQGHLPVKIRGSVPGLTCQEG